MGIATTQQLARYYDQYRDTEVIFTKDIIKTVKLDPRQVYIKCSGGQWPCIVNSASLQLVKIIIGTKGGAFAAINSKDATNANKNVNVRFCFFEPDGSTVTFLVSGKVTNISSYMKSNELAVVTITYIQRPPDDLIEIIGRLLEANTNANRRREERIMINKDSMRKLNLLHEESIINVQNVPRHCVVRSLSFFGAQVILMGLPKFLVNKPVILSLDFEEPNETIQLPGAIVDADVIEGKKQFAIASIKFSEQAVPLSYKIHLNNFLTTARKTQLSASDQIAMQRKAHAKAQAQSSAHSQAQNQVPQNQVQAPQESDNIVESEDFTDPTAE